MNSIEHMSPASDALQKKKKHHLGANIYSYCQNAYSIHVYIYIYISIYEYISKTDVHVDFVIETFQRSVTDGHSTYFI